MDCKLKIVHGSENTEVTCQKGEKLYDIISKNNIFIDAPCGGNHTCGKCKVVCSENGFSPISPTEKKFLSNEEIEKGVRLACSTAITGDATVKVLSSKGAKIQTGGKMSKVDLMPRIKKEFVKLDIPSIQNQTDDAKRLLSQLSYKNIKIPLHILRQLPNILKQNNYEVTVAHNGHEVISIEGGDTTDILYGIAIDIGTTTVVCYLVDIIKGKRIGVVSFLNPQKTYGGDVISRISYTMENEDGLYILHKAIIDKINEAIYTLCTDNKILCSNVYSVVIAANTTMLHLMLCVSPKNIATSPFNPAFCDTIFIPDRDIEISICGGEVVILPSVSGYVGADIVAGVVSCDMHKSDKLHLFIDIGTNGEIALGNSEKIVYCSTAAGPAFEGATIKWGIGGVTGAINTVSYIDGKISYTVIGDISPIGICGSGIIDAIATLVSQNIVDETGRMCDYDEMPKEFLENYIEIDGEPAFIISKEGPNNEPICITQKDVRQIQLAKAAIAGGILTLLDHIGKTTDDIYSIYLAGGFGSFINKKSATKIGLLPKESENKIEAIGNSAGMGAIMSLLSEKRLVECSKIKNTAHYIELSLSSKFQDFYMDCMYF